MAPPRRAPLPPKRPWMLPHDQRLSENVEIRGQSWYDFFFGNPMAGIMGYDDDRTPGDREEGMDPKKFKEYVKNAPPLPEDFKHITESLKRKR